MKQNSRPANGARAPFNSLSPAEQAWQAKTMILSTKQAVDLVVAGVCHHVNELGPHLFNRESIPYPTQMLLEEVIKELKKRV